MSKEEEKEEEVVLKNRFSFWGSDMTDAPRNITSRTSALSRWYAMPP
jgi:hypothetical protein